MDLEVPSEQAMCYVDKESHNGKMSGDSVNAKPFTPSTSPNGVIDYSGLIDEDGLPYGIG